MPGINTRKVRAFLKLFSKQQGYPKNNIRQISELPVIEKRVNDLKERVARSNIEGIPFDKNVEGLKNSIDTLHKKVSESQQLYQQSILNVQNKLEEFKVKQDEEHTLRLKQNKLIEIKSQIIVLEKKIVQVAKYNRPRTVEPLKDKLTSLKKQYKDIIMSHKELADVTEEVLTAPNLEHPEIAAPISVEEKIMTIDDLHKEIDSAPSSSLELPDIPELGGHIGIPSPLPEFVQKREMPPLPPAPEKKGLFSRIFRKRASA